MNLAPLFGPILAAVIGIAVAIVLGVKAYRK